VVIGKPQTFTDSFESGGEIERNLGALPAALALKQ
jgi:hypothetical protein